MKDTLLYNQQKRIEIPKYLTFIPLKIYDLLFIDY